MARHLSHSWDLVTLYYTNYVGFQIYNVPLRDLPLVIWYNLDGFLLGAGKLLIFDVPYGSKHLERVVAVAAIAGCVRLARRKRSCNIRWPRWGMSAILLVWHYPPDQRFVFPLYPLLLLALDRAGQHLRSVARRLGETRVRGSRGRFRRCGGCIGRASRFSSSSPPFSACSICSGSVRQLPRRDFEARRPAYQWIANNARPDANVYAYEDPLLFLYTGRKSCSLPDSAEASLSRRRRRHRQTDGFDGGFRARLPAQLFAADARRLLSRSAEPGARQSGGSGGTQQRISTGIQDTSRRDLSVHVRRLLPTRSELATGR